MLLETISFSSKRKRASVVVKTGDGNVRVYTKGAPDMLWDKLSGVIQADGSLLGINDNSNVADELVDEKKGEF